MGEPVGSHAEHSVPPVSHGDSAVAPILLPQGRLVVGLATAQHVASDLLLLADGVGPDARVLVVCGVLPLGNGGPGVAGTRAASAGELALPALSVEVFERPIRELLLAIVGVFRHGALVQPLIVLAPHSLAVEAIALTDESSHGGHACGSPDCVALPTLHRILQVSGPVVESLRSIGQLRAASCQEVGVGRIRSSALSEGVLVYLRISRFIGALVIVFVAVSAHARHADSAHARYGDAAIRTSLDDALLANLELGKSSLIVDPALASMRETT